MKQNLSVFKYVGISVAVADIGHNGASMRWQKQAKSGLVLLVVTGAAIGSRELDRSNPIVRRIIDNPELLSSEHADGTRIDYVRRSLLDDARAWSERSGQFVVGTVVTADLGSIDIDAEVDDVRRRRLSFNSLKSDAALRGFLAARLFRKLLLPVLLFWLVVLVANFFISSSLTEKLAEHQALSYETGRSARLLSEKNSARSKLVADYEGVAHIEPAVWSDAIASALSDGMRLTEILINEAKSRRKNAIPDDCVFISLKGESLNSETVSAFSENLKRIAYFRRIEVVSLNRVRNEDLSTFEIHVLMPAGN